MSEQYAVYVVDQRNHGRSGHHSVFNYEAMVDDLFEFINDHHLHQSVIIGHSMGGKTAMQFAFDHADLTDKLIVADISTEKYDHKHYKLIDAMLSVDLEKYSTRSEIQKALEDRIPDLKVRQFLMKNLYWKDRSSLGWKANLEVINENLPEVFREISTDQPFSKPTLFVRGSLSPYIKDEYIPKMMKMFPNATVETIEGASHWLHAEKPSDFHRIVKNFLEG
jgi:pimeloyl-ACP methyl ester carboxylesterase